jgi:Flp pilus assembly protein TadD
MTNYAPFRTLLMAGACLFALGACSKISETMLPTAEQSARAPSPKIDANAPLRLADAAYQRGEYAAAAPLYAKASELHPGKWDIRAKLGFALFKAGEHAEAEKVFRAILESQPQHADARRGIAHAFLAQGEAQEAITVYRQAIEAGGSGDHRLYAGLGAALDMSGRHAEARKAYETGLKLSPNDPALRNNLAMSYVMSRQYGRAKPLLEGLLSRPETAPKARETLAMLSAAGKPRTHEPPREELASAAPESRPRAIKSAADLPAGDADTEVKISTGLARAAEGPARSLGAAPGKSAIREDAAAEVLNLLAQAERGPRFVWQEARAAQGE